MQAKPADPVPALDPVLVRRLWRPVERPGVTDPGMARAMFTRHQRMVAGLPLAELVSRHTGASELAGMTVPIVYALPSEPPPTPDSRPSEAPLRLPASSPIAPGHPVLPASVSVPSAWVAIPSASVAAQLAPSAPTQAATAPSTAVPATHDVPPLVVQRTVATPAPAGPPGPGPHHADLQDNSVAEFDMVVARSPWQNHSVELGSTMVDHHPESGGTWPGPPGLEPMRLATPAGSRSVVVAVAAPSVPAIPGAASHPARAAGSASPLIVIARSAPWPRREHLVGALAQPMLAQRMLAQPPPGRADRVVALRDRTDSRPAGPLPLVDLAVAISRTTRDPASQRQPVAGRTPVPAHAAMPPHSAMPAQNAGPSPSADRHTPVRGQTSPQVNVEHLVEVVHRRFVRQLAIEAERRAVR